MTRNTLFTTAAAVLALIVQGYPPLHAQETGQGRHKQFYVVPVPGEVQIDGKLDDWDLSGQIEMYVVETSRSTRSAKIAAMYDEKALYLSGDINDDTPMLNRHNPRASVKPWDADAVQFRLTVDPEADYPIQESSLDYKGNKSKTDTRDDIVHLLLWYFSDAETANLQMQLGMTYRKPHPDWEPNGLVPADKFQGEYRRKEDGTGYTFEYRIPWSTLGAKRPLKGGDEVAGTVGVNWSTADGLTHERVSGSAYDILSESGFSFQKASTWGRVIFSETGNVPVSLVEAGVPTAPALPLEFSYDLPKDGEVTVQLFDAEGKAARIVVPQQKRKKGANTERWDGLDDNGRILPAGNYVWRGIVHEPLQTEFRFSVHNSGNPPYTTEDGKGGWGADHGVPRDVAAVKGGMILVWDYAEYGSGTVRTDADGTKLLGAQSGACFLTTDGDRYYTAGEGEFLKGPDVKIFDVGTARPVSLPNGVASFPPPPGGNEKSNQLTGLAWASQTLYVSYGARDLIALYSTEDGALKETWSVPTPGRLAVRDDGSLAVVSGNQVLSVKDGKVEPLLSGHLDEPTGIAVDREGMIYVANRGSLQNVSVFNASGKYETSIGRKGGRPAAGDYDRSGMLSPDGIAIDEQRRLWVAEAVDCPKRISVWDVKTGQNLKEFFGASAYFSYGFIDPARPDEILAHNVLWKIDWASGTTQPVSTVWRETAPNMMPPPGVSVSISSRTQILTADDGKQYMWGKTDRPAVSVLLRRDGNLFKPFAAVINAGRPTGIAIIDQMFDAQTVKTALFWQDANDDQTVQEGEVSTLPPEFLRASFAWLGKDLSFRLSTGQLFRPKSTRPNGTPVYDLTDPEQAGFPAHASNIAQAPDGSVISMNTLKGPSLVKWSPEGKMLWNYADLIPWRASLNMPPIKAGRLWAMTGMMGLAGNFFGIQTYRGPNHIFRDDGQYVGAILFDRRFVGRGPFAGMSEGQGGTFVKLNLDGKDRYFAIGGSQDVRVWEVKGLDTIEDLPGGVYHHTEEHVAQAAAARGAAEEALNQKIELSIAESGRSGLDAATPARRDLEDGRGFEVRLSSDSENLYLRFQVTSAAPLVNAIADPTILFRGGNLLDIMLATDPDADPLRKTPVAGDLRVMVTRRDDKPLAVVARPKVRGFTGQPTVLHSPTGKESFDSIEVVDSVGLDYERNPTGFTATVTIPKSLVGLTLSRDQPLKLDLGYIFGNETGTQTAARAYLFNTSFTSQVIDDVPHESRLEPAQWGSVFLQSAERPERGAGQQSSPGEASQEAVRNPENKVRKGPDRSGNQGNRRKAPVPSPSPSQSPDPSNLKVSENPGGAIGPSLWSGRKPVVADGKIAKWVEAPEFVEWRQGHPTKDAFSGDILTVKLTGPFVDGAWSQAYGALCKLPTPIPEGMPFAVSFRARSLSGSKYLSVLRSWGGAKPWKPILITDQWAEYRVVLTTEHPVATDTIVFSLVPRDGRLQPYCEGVFEVSDVQVDPLPAI